MVMALVKHWRTTVQTEEGKPTTVPSVYIFIYTRIAGDLISTQELQKHSDFSVVDVVLDWGEKGEFVFPLLAL